MPFKKGNTIGKRFGSGQPTDRGGRPKKMPGRYFALIRKNGLLSIQISDDNGKTWQQLEGIGWHSEEALLSKQFNTIIDFNKSY